MPMKALSAIRRSFLSGQAPFPAWPESCAELDVGTGYTHIYGDTNADLIADFEIVLTNGASLAATDFIL